MTPREILEARVVADYCHLTSVRTTTSDETVAALLAECVVRWKRANDIGDKLLVDSAERNMRMLADVWCKRNPGASDE